MLNISPYNSTAHLNKQPYKTFELLNTAALSQKLAYWLLFFVVLFVIILFLPWTQNIRAKGKVTTLYPNERPQTIQTTIAGRIEKWFVSEGQLIKKGDTIVFISEIKDDYFDPQLLPRTAQQIAAKKSAVGAYGDKAKALQQQIAALQQNQSLKKNQTLNKIKQIRLKIQTDSIDLSAALTNYDVALKQYERMQQLYQQGLKSLTELEQRELKFQEALAKKISSENKILVSRNELSNTQIELNSIDAEYADKIAKSESDLFSSLSTQYDAEGNVAKLENQYANYSARQGFYYITAPQDCYVTKAVKSGIGENLKEGDPVVTIMPYPFNRAVEMYIAPIDLPLVSIGSAVRMQFDGWPAIIFSGWPGASYGTYGGKVVGIDNVTNNEGKYRLLLKEDPNEPKWPEALRVGAGANCMALLKDVPVWYELWRQLNAFPPEFYETTDDEESEKYKQKPAKKSFFK